MKKYLLVGLCAWIVQCHVAMAQQQVSMAEAKKAAVQTLNLRQGQSKKLAYSEARVKKVNVLKSKAEKMLMYEAVFDDGQGVLLSGSKACLPVLGYFKLEGGKSIFDDDMPDGLKSMLLEYKEQIELCFKNDTIRLYHQNKWQALQQDTNMSLKNAKAISPKVATPSGNIIVAPLLNSCWRQDRPSNGDYSTADCDAYNYYAPNRNCDGCRVNALAGCVAVAMAQIMYYWKYPVYTPQRGMPYDWCNMVDSLNTNSPNYINERNAVARLIRDCGDAVGMDFECSSSSVNSANARDAFVEQFGYSSDADFQRRMFYSDDTWKNRVKDNLNQGRPVLYSGRPTVLGFIPDPESGHAFVCDGYSSDDMFHFNWGWERGYETWFTLDDIVPKGSYNSYQRALFYLYPNNSQDYCSYDLSLLEHYAAMTNYAILVAYNGGALPPNVLDGIIQNVPRYATRLTSAYPASLQGVITTTPSSWYTIPTGATREYVAHESITLKPGFHAQAGSNFTARIEPCNSCTSNSTLSAVAAVKNLPVTGDALDEEFQIEEEQSVNVGQPNKTTGAELHVYPNPTTGFLTVQAANVYSHIQRIELYTVLGVEVFICDGNNSYLQEINISHLPPQLYILKVQVDNQAFTKRLVLQK